MSSRPPGYRLEIQSGSDVTPETEAERQRLEEAAAKFGTDQWDGQPLQRPGTRIPVPASQPQDSWNHLCGGRFTCGSVFCPACRTELLPIFRLDMSDPRVSQVVCWPLPAFELPVCPGCLLFHSDYAVDFSQTPFTILSDELPCEQEPLVQLVTPYETRRVTLRPLAPDESPGEGELCDNEGHQIGGIPPRWFSEYRHNACPKCSKLMEYAAVIHYDSGNVPLFETYTRKIDKSHSEVITEPVAFCLGDCKSYYVFTCSECLMLTYRFAM